MTWHAVTDHSDATWARTAFRDDSGRFLWLRAGPDVTDPGWLLQTLGRSGEVRTVETERPVTTSDAVAAAPEVAHELMRVTREVLDRYDREAPGSGAALAEELRDALGELEREDVRPTAGGTHTKRGEDVAPPPGRGG